MATATDREKIRLSLDVSPELYALLESLAERTDESKSDVLRKAIVLMDVAVKASQEGKRLLVQDPPQKNGQVNQTEIIGLFPPRRNPAVHRGLSVETMGPMETNERPEVMEQVDTVPRMPRGNDRTGQ